MRYCGILCLALLAGGVGLAQDETDAEQRAGETLVINVEVDWLVLPGGHDHRLSDCEMDAVVAAFSRNGIVLNIEWGDAIEETEDNRIINMIGGSFGNSPDWQAIVNEYRDHPPGSGWHYCLLGHQYANNGVSTTSSGLAEIGGDECMVTLGGWTGQTGLPFHRSGTFMHEFGHNLTLRHGGFENSNYKPNYVSVMNYHYQVSGVWNRVTCNGLNDDGSSPLLALDYSHGRQDPLDESALLEEVGMGYGEVDWNCDDVISESPVAKRISGSSNFCTAGGSLRVVNDYDDWDNIVSNAFARIDTETVACVTKEEMAERGPDPCDTPDPCLILLPPSIVISTDSIEATLGLDEQVISMFDISNGGELPLEWSIEETNGLDCSPLAASWLSLSRTSGITASANNDLIEVTIDTTGLAVGLYDAGLCIASNDGIDPTIIIPVSLNILPNTFPSAVPFWQSDPLYLNVVDLLELLP